jgi:outer membrane receptor protein involved in Fe transport
MPMPPVRNLLVICAVSGILVFSSAEAFEELSHDIAAQPLAQALGEFAEQTGLQLIYVSEIAATQASQGAPRGLAAPDGLRQLLAGTGLGFEFLNDRTVRIVGGPSCALQSGCGAPPSGTAAQPPKGPSALSPLDSLEEVIVAGPRWWLDPKAGPAPVTVLDRRDIERGGESSIGDVLQKLPMTTGSLVNTNANVGLEPRADRVVRGDGSVRFSIHGLPAVTLLNGRRLPNSGFGADASVDLNTLPMSFVERVEVLAGGASAPFGADAVGGVVNIVTQPSQQGLELRGSRTVTDHGDGEIATGQAAMGFDLLGGTWSVGVDYVDQHGVTMDRRSYSALPYLIIDGNGTVAPVGFNNLPREGGFYVPEGNVLGLAPGFYTPVPGANLQTPNGYRPYVRERDGFNPAPYHYLQTPNQRVSLWLLGSRPLGETTNLFLEGFLHQRESAQQAAPAYYMTRTGMPTESGIPADNHYNPFGVDVPFLQRRLGEADNRRFEQDVELWRALIGLEGRLDRWTWELALQGAESRSVEVEKGSFDLDRVLTALGPSGPDASGRIVCGAPDPSTGLVPADSIIPGCVPIDFFGGAGSVTEEQLAYVMPRPFINRGTNEQRLAEFVLSGPGGGLLGRELQWTLGGDYRYESGSLAPDPLREVAPLGLSYPMLQLGGSQEASELYAGVQIPLLHDRRWARDMTANVGVRWSDYSTFDQNVSWQAGLRWQAATELTLRANYADVFRPPSLAELYSPQVHGESLELDPCGNEPTDTQRANCEANGVPGGAYEQEGEGFMLFTGGNQELEPETGHSIGVGLVYTPAWAKGLSASVDYFQVELADYIWQASPDQVLYECAERGIRSACEAISRTPDGRVSQLLAINENFGLLDVRSFDFAINWASATRLGDVNSSLLATYLERWDWHPIPGGEVYSRAGNFNAGARPRWRAAGNVDWRSGPWMASYAVEYIGSYSETVFDWAGFGYVFEYFERRVEPVMYHDIEAGFSFDSGVTVRAVITNFTDEDPPYLNVGPANTDVTTYRLLGRSYFLELRYQFQ